MKRSGYGGVMVWTLDTDDYDNECCTGVYPLLREVNAALGRISSQDTKHDCTKPIIVPLLNDTELTTITEMPADGRFFELSIVVIILIGRSNWYSIALERRVSF